MSDTEGPSRREAIEAAMNASEEAETSTPVEATTTPEPVEAAPEAPVAAVEESPKPDSESKVRDGKGRFQRGERAIKPTVRPAQKLEAPAAPAPTKPGVAAAPVATGTPAATPAPELKAPQSWKPAAREKWGTTPPEVQAEVQRREREVAQVLQETTNDRNFSQAMNRVMAPYQAMLQSSGAPAPQLIGSLLQTAHGLAYGPVPQRAQIVAHLMKSYGLSGQDGLQALANALDGSAPQGGQPAIDPNQFAQQVEQRILGTLKQQREQAAMAGEAKKLEAWGKDKEFLSDVRHEMADILELADKRGLSLSWDDAYNRACMLHPEISGVMAQRKAVQQANATMASTQRARAASSSIRSQPSGAVSAPQPAGRRAALEAAFEQHNNR